MFSGIGGFEKAIQEVIPNAECVGYSEIEETAVSIYEKNFPTHKNYGNARRIVCDDLADFDFLCGGFPCQSFSIAGKRGGFEDTRGTLFFEIARVLAAKRPKLLLLENVKGLLSHDNGNTFGTILSTLSELGYFLQWQVLNSKDYVAQNRERVFIVGYNGNECPPQVFPISRSCEEPCDLQSASEGQQQGIPSKVSHERREDERVESGRQGSERPCSGRLEQVGNVDTKGHNSIWGRVYDPAGISSNLNAEGGGLGAKSGLYWTGKDKADAFETLSVLQDEIGQKAMEEWCFGVYSSLQSKEVLQPKVYGKGLWKPTNKEESAVYDSPLSRKKIKAERVLRKLWEGKCFGRSSQRQELEKQCSEELATLMQELSQQSTQVRVLTPVESERLQGFPDGWTEGHSDNARKKCLGNAVTVDVVKQIIVKFFIRSNKNGR